MRITKTVTKKILESIVHETFANLGTISSSLLLDSLKLLGFYYSTNAGISINIEDLKTPNVKKDFLEIAQIEINSISEKWEQGFVSDTERFQTIIDSWNVATESLKNRIVDYYENFDPANNLYIMAFSGARGNMSQVRQLVGMRGLMSDQEGKIIDLPIQTNFREGLSSIDYIISSYGARKGIVDTALKTADSGYLTRRLIYIAQDLVIREIDCKTKNGVILLLNEKSKTSNLLGRVIISSNLKSLKTNKLDNNQIIEEETIQLFKKFSPLTLNIRSTLTCKSPGSICQKCYGWDLSQRKLISLGEAVGIIAAQSIGEPGTQLTMRTFHTGGIFTSETLKQIVAPFSGKIVLPDGLKTISYRTNHGTIVSKLQQETNIKIIDWKGKSENIFLEIGSFLYISSSTFVRKNELISEYSTQSTVPGGRKLKPIYTSTSGEIRFENLSILKTYRDKRTIKVTKDHGIIWLASGKIFSISKEAKYQFPKCLNKIKSFADLKLITPSSGIVEFNKKKLSIYIKGKKFEVDFSKINKQFINCRVDFTLLVNNYQYVDKHTILGKFNIKPIFSGKTYAIRKKDSKYLTTFFIVTEDDIWKLNTEQINNNLNLIPKKTLIRERKKLNDTLEFSKSGFFLKKDGFKYIFQNAVPIFLSAGTIINYKKGDLVLKNTLFATLVNYTQQTEDIVQGLPKIEELIEARKPKNKSYLCARPGILFDTNFETKKVKVKNDLIICEGSFSDELTKRGLKKKKSFVQIFHAFLPKQKLNIYNNKIVNITKISSDFYWEKREKKEEYILQIKNASSEKKSENRLSINNKFNTSIWLNYELQENQRTIYTIKNGFLQELTNLDITEAYKNKKLDQYYIFKSSKKEYILLEFLNPIDVTAISLSSKILFKNGEFIDIGEPLTEGIIDVHELLSVLSKYHISLDGTLLGTLKSLNKFQLLLLNSIQSIYQSQGVNISNKHIEIIVRQMTSRVVILKSGDTPLLPGEFHSLSFVMEIYKSISSTKLYKNYRKKKPPVYEPLLLSTTNSSLNKDGFLSSAGFQETKRILTKAAIEGTSDWLRGLKESVIIGRIVPAGSAFLNYKNYLDNIHLFKK
jgi:hypothetical protein